MHTVPDHNGFQIQLRRRDCFGNDVELIASLRALIAPSYEDPVPLLDRELQHCTHLYLGYNHGEVVCFFLVAWELLTLNGSQYPAVYMGLSATRKDTRNSGIVRRAYLQALQDASRWEDQSGQRLVVWATTATPTAYLFSRALLQNVQPYPDGSFDRHAAEIASAIRHQHGYGDNSEHPFVLKGIAHGTRYSSDEVRRIEKSAQGKHFALFHYLNIAERCGDRLLIVARTRNG